jgi:predicted RNase H-like HicB family nuclease
MPVAIRDALLQSRKKVMLHEPLMLKIESEREEDGRWIAEVPALPGVLVYGATESEARAKAQALALRAIADRIENGEPLPREIAGVFEAA